MKRGVSFFWYEEVIASANTWHICLKYLKQIIIKISQEINPIKQTVLIDDFEQLYYNVKKIPFTH